MSALSLDSVSSESAGEYTCIARNRGGSVSYSAVLNVNGSVICELIHVFLARNLSPTSNHPLRFWRRCGRFRRHNLFDLHHSQGRPTSRHCLAAQRQNHHKSRRFYDNARQKSQHSEHRFGVLGTSGRIYLPREEFSWCHVAFNGFKRERYGFCCNFYLAVPPQITPFEFGDESVNSGELVSVTCSVHKGDLPIEISWFHDNRSLVDGDGVTILKSRKVNTLSVESVSFESAGEYRCVARNNAGSAAHSAILNVNGT